MVGSVKASFLVLVMTLSVAGLQELPEPDPANPHGWEIETVVSGDYARGNSLTIDSWDRPHVSYYPRSDLALNYTNRTADVWAIEAVDPWKFGRGTLSSIALDSGDSPHISYAVGYWDGHYDPDLRYAKWTGTQWSLQTLETKGYVGIFNSLVLDCDDRPHIAYTKDFKNLTGTRSNLKYTRWNGSAWNTQIVDPAPGHIYLMERSMSLDSRDYPHISYSVLINESYRLKYARWNGSAWEIEVVDSLGDVGYLSSLALDSSDHPHIGYLDGLNGDLKYARWNGSAWEIEIVDSFGDVGHGPSLSLDGDDHPHIAYQDLGNEYLKYAFWNGDSWEIEVVDDAPAIWHHVSLALNSSDYPHITYADYSVREHKWDLKYAYMIDLPPPPRTISFDLDPDTLNLKSRGRWVTAYLSAENASVRDIDISTVLLQDTLQAERYDYQGDVLMLKFNRNQLQRILPTGESVEVKISGKWNDGSVFEAYDYIRVINPPMIQLPPRFRNPSPIIF